MHGKLTKEEYEVLVAEALQKLNAKYDSLPARPEEQEIVDKIRQADGGQLKRIIEILKEE